MPQQLSYARAFCSNRDNNITDFFGKLGAVYGKLNLISKPMQVYNSDETGVTIVHKPGKVLAELGRRHVYSVTSGEKGRTDTVLSCISASGFVLPPCIYSIPVKEESSRQLKEEALPDTLFCNSDNASITSLCTFFHS